MQLLLLSNSTLPGEPFYQWPRAYVDPYIRGKRVLFAPFAAPEAQYEAYTAKVQEVFGAMGAETIGMHTLADPATELDKADVVAIGGGNSFLLLRTLYRLNLVRAIAERVKRGLPYLGWSAGSNVACPTIMTTNDMPIVEPPSLRAMHLVPFQINPHYTEATIPDHGGESRDQRIAEYLALNPHMTVAGLREGSLLHVDHAGIKLHGRDMQVFRAGADVATVTAGSVLRSDLAPVAARVGN